MSRGFVPAPPAVKRNRPAPHVIEVIYAWVAMHADGSEGVCALVDGETQYPMIGSDMARMNALRPAASRIAAQTGLPVRLVVWGQRCVIDMLGTEGSA